MEPILKDLHAKYGPIITVYFGRRPAIFVASHELAHCALVQNGATFADRPPPLLSSRVMSNNQKNINTSYYGPTWRLFRRNLTAEMLHPLRGYGPSPSHEYAMFSVPVLMCFGDRLDEKAIKQVEDCHRPLLLNVNRFDVLGICPRLGKENHEMDDKPHERSVAYVDSLLNLELLNEQEIIALCSEFLNAATDTTSTALQWIMANVVKYPGIQQKLYQEIRGVVEAAEEKVDEDHLQSMPYLKAVVLERLRRHPPGHFVLPHAVTEDFELWEDPMEFRPERFLSNGGGGGTGEGFDVTGSREIRMIPFGAGRRMCPAHGLALLHLDYFLANLIWRFHWKAVDEVDLTEKLEFTVVMKNPPRALISPR
ncbi:hypothetical protein MLD38_040074 [Melastoma candidum]|uniref:Uncharacterized protein n=1 Tax=Melastoma candidum TaxID=119954 RepID=A0ACB9L4K1_9MYRT|nr:hypothetical protein MLD38_040074 [Melastoma candidum]